MQLKRVTAHYKTKTKLKNSDHFIIKNNRDTGRDCLVIKFRKTQDLIKYNLIGQGFVIEQYVDGSHDFRLTPTNKSKGRADVFTIRSSSTNWCEIWIPLTSIAGSFISFSGEALVLEGFFDLGGFISIDLLGGLELPDFKTNGFDTGSTGQDAPVVEAPTDEDPSAELTDEDWEEFTNKPVNDEEEELKAVQQKHDHILLPNPFIEYVKRLFK